MKTNLNKNLKAHFAILSLVAIVAVIGVVGLIFAAQSFNNNSSNLGGNAIMMKQPTAIITKPIDINPVDPIGVGDSDCGVCCCVASPVNPDVALSSGLYTYGSSNDANFQKSCSGLSSQLGGQATTTFYIESSSSSNCKDLCGGQYVVSNGVYSGNGLTLNLTNGIYENPEECSEEPATPVSSDCPEKDCCFVSNADLGLVSYGTMDEKKCLSQSNAFFVHYLGDKTCNELATQYSTSASIPSAGASITLDECNNCLSCCCEPNNNFYISTSQRECTAKDGVFVSLLGETECKDVCGSSLVNNLNTNFYIQDECKN